MPLTTLQKEVLHLLAANRNPESHVAGGAVINRSDRSPRYSADLDVFHDVAQSVVLSAEADARLLIGYGFAVEWLVRQPFLQRAKLARGDEEMRLDWCHDAAFRFFPVQPDAEFGYCLHQADLATNKALALAGRSEIRDFLDVLYLHESYLSLGAMCWAACGKDQGFTPWSLLEQAKRNVKFRNGDLEGEHLARPLQLTDLKEEWLRAVAHAEIWFGQLPPGEVGCLYLDSTGSAVTLDPASKEFSSLRRHCGSVRGTWPKPS